MWLYLFGKARTGINTSDLKRSKNNMVTLTCCIHVTKHPGAKKTMYLGNYTPIPELGGHFPGCF